MRDLSRRQFGKLVSATGIAGVLGIGSAAGEPGQPEDVEEFATSGKQIERTKIRPEQVEVTQTVVSRELDERYGNKQVEFRTVFERVDPASDPLPQSDVRVERGPWEGYYATEEDWQRVYGEGRTDVSDVSASTGAASAETSYPYGVYEYAPDSSGDGFVVAAPMNVLSERSIGPIKNVATNDHYVGSGILQSDRYAYNTDTYSFETQHDALADTIDRTLGGQHARMWEFGGWTSISAHVDSAIPHSAISFEDAERDLETVFDEAPYWYGDRDNIYLGNDYLIPSDAPDDHNGYVTELVSY